MLGFAGERDGKRIEVGNESRQSQQRLTTRQPQDKRNAELSKGYKITGPALIVVKVEENKAVEYSNLKEIWTKSRDKKEFIAYVRDGVAACWKPEPKTARK